MRLLKSIIISIIWSFSLISCNGARENQKKEVDNKLNKESILTNIEKANDKSFTKTKRKLYLDSAYNQVKKLKESSFQIQKLEKISVGYYFLNELNLYKDINQEALIISKNIKDSIITGKLYGNLGIYYRKMNLLDSAYQNFYSANKIFFVLAKNKKITPSKYSFDYGKVLIDLAKLSRKVKDYNNSEDLTIHAIKQFQLSGNLSYLPLSYTSLGITARELGRFDDAIEYNQKALKYASNTDKDILYKIIVNNNLGMVYQTQGNYEKAEKFFKKNLKYVDFFEKDLKRKARLLDNIGYVKLKHNKHNDSILFLLNKAYKIRDSIGDIRGLSESSLSLTEYYFINNNYSLSRTFGIKAEKAATTTNSNTGLLQAYDLLAQVSPPEEGRKYAMEYIKLNDSLTKRDNLFRDKFARIRFESENLEKENQQKSKEIEEVQNQNTVYLLGILLLATFIGFIIYFSRQRTKYLAQQNKIVEFQAAYETETRISKRLHDEIGNDIFQVMMQYQNDPHDPQITKKLNTAYTKARDISRENSEFEVDETYTEELTDMLTNYTNNNIRLVQRGIDKIVWNTMDKNLKITIYRVLQELMTNMQKHSQADLVAIVFKNEKNNLIIKYSDNGVGIQKSAIKSKNGLRNTEKRILAINGTIIFDSEKNKGFKAEIKIPC
ncbi:tetratricopeptide repeat-containing sensor histidine kinase [Aquimarina sp. Aq107]|uniref:tetratricopeptide repeat-containing sensor histidine kinase n=1 Tax=Aquimarina sp. Aq107 TaxID=1191912 RepID=UPI000D55A3E1|nr:tetratricopeptide repeat-containing sensor histidine kinase [Aquimarina sp. Aq107]